MLNKKKFFPACVDDFFINPNVIREYGLNLKKKPEKNGKWPGVRSRPLHEIDLNLNTYILSKIFSVYFDSNFHIVNWGSSEIYFQEIEKFSNDKKNLKNVGWIHVDSYCDLAGLIYLTPDADISSGTSLYNIKEKYKKKFKFKEQLEKNKFYSGKKISDNVYNKAILKNNNLFYEKTRFNNIYNRLIVYDANEFHKANNFFNKNNKRLTLVFFVKDVTINTKCTKWPVDKIMNTEIFDNHIEQIILKNKN